MTVTRREINAHLPLRTSLANFAFVLGLGLVFQTAGLASEADTNSAKLYAAAQERWERNRIGAVSLGVVRNGKPESSRHIGSVDEERKRLPTDATYYLAGSVTKAFTALAIMQLIEAKKLRLTESAAKYVPEINRIKNRDADEPPITIVQS
ncbi:MAG TPA: serine hydrolase domain-containing protein [Luteimonas sp.]|nr:serine hydrolase domain-containing protein [Luteimonas sp.]